MMKIFLSLLCTLSFLSSSVIASTGEQATNATNPEAGQAQAQPQAVANPYTEATVGNITDCMQAENDIKNYCTMNPELAAAQQNSGLLAMTQRSISGLQAAKDGEFSAIRSLTSVAEIRNTCNAAENRCLDICANEMNRHGQSKLDAENAARNGVPGAGQLAQVEQQQIDRKKQVQQSCSAEAKQLETTAVALNADLVETLLALGMIITALGGEPDPYTASLASNATDGDEDSDPCSGENADLYVQCDPENGNSTTAGTRGDLTTTGVPAASTTGTGLFGPGADLASADGDSGSATGGSDNPFGSAGFGGGGGGLGTSGFGGAGAGAGGGTGTDGSAEAAGALGEGYMSTGGGGGGGGFSGGGGGMRTASAGAMGSLGSASSNRAAKNSGLNRKLDKYAKDPKRKLASANGTAGPFEDIWGVVNKAYKKNSSTMFHNP